MPYTQITKVRAKYLHEKRGRYHPRSEVLGGNLQPKMKYAHAIADGLHIHPLLVVHSTAKFPERY